VVTNLAIIGMLSGLGALALAGFTLCRARTLEGEARTLMNRTVTVQNSGVDPQAVRDVAVLHYDALEEMSGARSFSLALLNSQGDGVVVTSINGRTESRTYAKEIIRGDAESLLSNEEYRVLRAARLGNGIGGSHSREPEPEPESEAMAPVTPDGTADTGQGPDEGE